MSTIYIYEQIKKDRMAAMKTGDQQTKSVLTVFVGDLQNQEKRGEAITDGYVIAQLKKATQASDENLKIRYSESDEATVEVLNRYVPQQMTHEDLETHIDSMIRNDMNFGEMMKSLKENFAGFYDAKEASLMVKEKLNK
jgi:uncharacterized protein YqeY